MDRLLEYAARHPLLVGGTVVLALAIAAYEFSRARSGGQAVSPTEAVRLMNDTEYGLTAGVYTQDRQQADQILSQLRAGSVYWNCCDRVSPRLPWSGVGHSGVGLTLSTYGIETFTRPKAWHLKSA